MSGRADVDASLLRTSAPEVLNVLVRRGADFARAEDAVQDAILKAITAWQNDPPRDRKGWLITTAWRAFIDLARSESARRGRELRVEAAPRAGDIVGVSAGGAFAQLLALNFADRVLSLVLISSSPATPATLGDRGLPPPTGKFGRFVATAEVDWSDPESVVEYLVGYSRVHNGERRGFDEAASREFVRRDVERARNAAALQNHDAIAGDDRTHEPLSAIKVPTWRRVCFSP